MKINDEAKKKILIYTTIVFVLIFSLLYIVFLKNSKDIRKINIDNYNIVDINSYDISLDVIEDSKNLFFKGYCLYKNEDIKTSSINVILKNKTSNNYYLLPTNVLYLQQNDNSMNNGWSGFESQIYKNDINQNEEYDIYLLVNLNGNEKVIDIKKSLY